MDNNKDLIRQLQQFLKNEEEIFGPLVLSSQEDHSAGSTVSESENGSKESDENSAADESVDRSEGRSVIRSIDDAVAGSESESSMDSPALESGMDRTQAHGTDPKEKDVEPGQATGVTHPDQCTTLDELKDYCTTLTDLKTDLPDTKLVFGTGNPNADLMIIGEAPGEQEDRAGVPFVGAAGQLLDKILAAIDFKREDVYIANILKHRPPGNRNPSHQEIQRSLPVLNRQIDLINPKVILCVGKVPGTTLLGKDVSLGKLRGQFYPFRNAQLSVTYHPAALLRNPKWKRPVWEDVQKVRQKYDELGGKP